MTDEPGSDVASTVRAAYDTVAAAYADVIKDPSADDPETLRLLDDFIERVGTGGRVLDAGCGAGRITRHLAAKGISVVGLDLSPGMIAMARRDDPRGEYLVGSLTDLPYGHDTFAGVLAWFSLIHLPDDAFTAAIGEIVRACRPGGHILVASQSGAGVVDVAPAYARRGFDVTLVRYRRTADVLGTALSDAGAEMIGSVESVPDQDGTDPEVAVLARVPG